VSVIRDTPALLQVFFEKDRTSRVRRDRDRDQAIRDGYAAITDDMVRQVPAGVCVDDVRRWAGDADDEEAAEVEPFGFAWGMDPPFIPGSCVDFDPRKENARDLRNKWVGAERAPCDGFEISCASATGAAKGVCGRWNTFSAEYLQQVRQLRTDAFNEHSPSGRSDTHTDVKSPSEVAADAANGWFVELTKSIARGAATLLGEAMTWWTRTDRSEMLQGPAISNIHSLLWYVGLVVLVGSVVWQGILLMYRRKPDPLINTGLGLLSFIGWSTLGTTAAVLLYQAGNALSSQVLDTTINRFADKIGSALDANVAVAVAAMFLLSIVLFFVAVIQWVLGFFRMGALVIVLALLPTAAAGQINEATKPWLRKVISWALSLILYQPIAAVVFAIGFVLLGDGDDVGTVLTGMAVLVLAVLCMPVMLRFFDWGGARFTSGGSGGGGSMALGALASVASGSGAVGFSRYMDHNGPGSRGGQDRGAVSVSPAHAGDGPGTNPEAPGDAPSDGGTPPGVPSGVPGGSEPAGAQPAVEATASHPHAASNVPSADGGQAVSPPGAGDGPANSGADRVGARDNPSGPSGAPTDGGARR
jgi:hypothetical protein